MWGFWELNLSHLVEQSVLLITELSLQPLILDFEWGLTLKSRAPQLD